MEPVARQLGNLLERTALFKDVGGTWHDGELLRPSEFCQASPVQIEDELVRPAGAMMPSRS